MLLSTSLLPRADFPLDGIDLAIAIDVLRATSVMTTALEAGASQIITCSEIDDAFSLADRLAPRPLLCGERGCQPIDGFDLGNSPAEYVSARVSEQSLVLTTTNGTRAIEASGDCQNLITASFLNLSAVVETIAGHGRVHLICAGTEGQITAEDALLAGAILCESSTRYGANWSDDESTLAAQLFRSWFPTPSEFHRESLSHRLRETRGGRNLIRLGYQQDLHRCSAIDTARAIPTRVALQPSTFALQARA